MKTNALAIHGVGAVTPNGLGVEALLKTEPWTTGSLASLKNSQKKFPVFLVDQTHDSFKRWQKELRLRRASSLSLFMIEAAEQALADAASSRDNMGMVAALNTGCITYSRRFFQGILEQGQRFASPALFPETVFNSPLSHLASILGVKGACYTVIGDNAAWATALNVASTWLRLGEVESVLVLGAEELDPIALEAYAQARWLHPKKSFRPAEGAGAILLKLSTEKDDKVLTQIYEGYPYRNRSQARKAAESCFKNAAPKSYVIHSASHTWMAEIEKECNRSLSQISNFPYCGEAFTASSAWHTLRAITQLSPDKSLLFQPIWGLNHQISALEFQWGYGKVKDASS